MKLYIAGSTFAPSIFREIWPSFGFEITRKLNEADLVFYSKDTPIAEDGTRNQDFIRDAVADIFVRTAAPLVLTSQVTPGFTRSLGLPIYHMAETLRIKDARERALKPDYIVIGCPNAIAFNYFELPVPLMQFVARFETTVIKCTWEEAEFSKIAVNMTLASQVDNTNRLAEAAKKVGADWGRIANILKYDKRIGPHSYLEPGEWRKSQHLLRDYVTLRNIENGLT